MGIRRGLIATLFPVLALGLAFLSPAFAQDKWLPVTPEELALTSCAEQPGAPAVYLFREEVWRDEDLSVSTYSRLKVLTAAGKDYANVEIPVFRRGYYLKSLKARTVKPNGGAQDFTGQVLEKTVLRFGRIKVAVKTFALPDVDVGSIIEYRCRFVFDPGKIASSQAQDVLESLGTGRREVEEGGVPPIKEVYSLGWGGWEISARLFTYKAHYAYYPFNKGQIHLFGRNMRLAWSSHGLEGGPPEMYGNAVEFRVQNVPGYEAEEYMPPEDPLQMGVDFFFLDNTIGGAEQYWRDESAAWRQQAAYYMSFQSDIKAEGEKLLSGMPDPVSRLKKLYERAQQVRNLSYDRTLTQKEVKAQGIKPDRSADEVLTRNYGLRSDITRFFCVLARTAGFPADVARVVSRDDKFFHDNLISLYGQFDAEVTIVKAGDREWILDPATPSCPFGTVPWYCSDTTAITTRPVPSIFITVPASPPEAALTKREFNLLLDASGNLTGSADVVFHGQEALVRRLEHLDDDEITAKKDLENDMTALLPAGAKVALLNVENLKNSEPDIRARFGISIPGIANAAGDRMLLAVSATEGGRQSPFRHARRTHSVYFPYPYRETDDVVIALPAGMVAESIPEPRQHRRTFSEYTLNCSTGGDGKLSVHRDLIIKTSLVPVEQYAVLKSFFDQVRQSDEGQIVLVPSVKK